ATSSDAPAHVWFEWGSSILNQKSEEVQIPAGRNNSKVFLDIDHLTPNTYYHCRLVVRNKDHVQYGEARTFYTPEVWAKLQDIATNLGPLTPGFSLGVRDYQLNVAASDDAIRIIPLAASSAPDQLTISVDGSPTASGSESAPIQLKPGATTRIKVVVLAPIGYSQKKEKKEYTIEVTRPKS
ncbi:MAG TPA: cadherin-like beta sandwich domain-containing protein, partial [Rariglobus sp.]